MVSSCHFRYLLSWWVEGKLADGVWHRAVCLPRWVSSQAHYYCAVAEIDTTSAAEVSEQERENEWWIDSIEWKRTHTPQHTRFARLHTIAHLLLSSLSSRRFTRAHLFELLSAGMLIAVTFVLMQVQTGAVYHFLKHQDTKAAAIKL